jgi:O-antigen/teichoic acid export membrane protein
VVGVVSGEAAVGMLTWASWVARSPAMPLFMMQRIYLPAFSRMLDHPRALARFVENILFTANASVAPAAVLALLLADRLPPTLFGEQWASAVPMVLPYWIGMLPLAMCFPLFGLLGAFGRARIAFLLAATQALVTWVAGTALVLAFGAMGAAWAAPFSGAVLLAAIPIARHDVHFAVAPAFAAPWTAAAVTAAVLLAVRQRWLPDSIVALAACSLLAFAVYAAVLAMLAPQRARAMLTLIAQSVAPRRDAGTGA